MQSIAGQKQPTATITTKRTGAIKPSMKAPICFLDATFCSAIVNPCQSAASMPRWRASRLSHSWRCRSTASESRRRASLLRSREQSFQVTLLQVADLQWDATSAVLGLMTSNSGLSLAPSRRPAGGAAVLILTVLDSRCGRDLLWEGNHEAGEGPEGGPWRAEVLLSGGWQKVFTRF